MYDALTIAMYIISKCFAEGRPVSNLRLQKLLYFVQLESYKRRSEPMFLDNMVAWQFGPVLRDIYYQYNMYGGSPILLSYNNLSIDTNCKQIIDDVILINENIPIWQLVDMTHEQGGPWDVTVNSKGINAYIEKDLIAQEASKTHM